MEVTVLAGSKTGRHLKPASAVLIVILTASLLSACSLGSTVGAVVLGKVLSDLEQSVAKIVDDASQQGQILLVTAGGQVQLALSNAESAFAEQLNEDINKLDDVTRNRLDQLQALVSDLQKKINTTLDGVIDGAQQLINTLPFTNKNPQVRRFSPRISDAGISTDVDVTVDGNFFWASERKLSVSLQVGNTSYQPAGNITSQLDFLIPASIFKTAPQTVSRVSMTLIAPFEKGHIFKTIQPGIFHLLVTVLPAAPVKELALTNKTHVKGTATQTKTQPPGASTAGGGWTLNSWQDCSDHEDHHSISADPGGWSIVPSTVSVGYSYQRNPEATDAKLTAVSVTGFVVKGNTTAHCFLGISKGSGAMTYFVQYDQTKSIETVTESTAPVSLPHWGDEADLPVSRNEWSVHAVLWDGSVHDWSTSNHDNPYLSITEEGDHVHIAALSPGSIIAH